MRLRRSEFQNYPLTSRRSEPIELSTSHAERIDGLVISLPIAMIYLLYLKSMAFTPEDTATMKDLLDELKQEIIANIERKITTLETNLERKMSQGNLLEDNKTIIKLRREIQTTEDNLKQAMKQA